MPSPFLSFAAGFSGAVAQGMLFNAEQKRQQQDQQRQLLTGAIAKEPGLMEVPEVQKALGKMYDKDTLSAFTAAAKYQTAHRAQMLQELGLSGDSQASQAPQASAGTLLPGYDTQGQMASPQATQPAAPGTPTQDLGGTGGASGQGAPVQPVGQPLPAAPAFSPSPASSSAPAPIGGRVLDRLSPGSKLTVDLGSGLKLSLAGMGLEQKQLQTAGRVRSLLRQGVSLDDALTQADQEGLLDEGARQKIGERAAGALYESAYELARKQRKPPLDAGLFALQTTAEQIGNPSYLPKQLQDAYLQRPQVPFQTQAELAAQGTTQGLAGSGEFSNALDTGQQRSLDTDAAKAKAREALRADRPEKPGKAPQPKDVTGSLSRLANAHQKLLAAEFKDRGQADAAVQDFNQTADALRAVRSDVRIPRVKLQEEAGWFGRTSYKVVGDDSESPASGADAAKPAAAPQPTSNMKPVTPRELDLAVGHRTGVEAIKHLQALQQQHPELYPSDILIPYVRQKGWAK
jgi:hypothetical protein